MNNIEQLIIRRSKVNEHLILAMNIENVYRVYLGKEEKINGINYDEVSNYFDQIEKTLV